MAHQVYTHPALPALIRAYDNTFKVDDLPILGAEDVALLDIQPQKVYYITDIREINISFEDMIKGASGLSHGPNKYHHQNVIENLMVVEHRMLELAAQNLKSSAFGSIHIKTFHSLEEALAYIQQQQGVSH